MYCCWPMTEEITNGVTKRNRGSNVKIEPMKQLLRQSRELRINSATVQKAEKSTRYPKFSMMRTEAQTTKLTFFPNKWTTCEN